MYREVLERSRLPRLARDLFCSALVIEGAGEPEQAGWRFLQAAWACDDRNAVAQAATCRARSAEMFARALETGETGAPEPVVLTLSADVWRRSGRFDEAIAAAAEAERILAADTEDEDSAGAAAVAAFIRGLAEEGDDGLHNVAEVFADES